MADNQYISRDEFRAEMAEFHKDWSDFRTQTTREWAEFRVEMRTELSGMRVEMANMRVDAARRLPRRGPSSAAWRAA